MKKILIRDESLSAGFVEVKEEDPFELCRQLHNLQIVQKWLNDNCDTCDLDIKECSLPYLISIIRKCAPSEATIYTNNITTFEEAEQCFFARDLSEYSLPEKVECIIEEFPIHYKVTADEVVAYLSETESEQWEE